MFVRWFAFVLLPSGLFLGESARAQAPKLDPALPYQATRKTAVTHDVDFSVVVTPPYHCKVLKVWLPVPQSDFAQEMIGDSDYSTFPQQVLPRLEIEPVFGNKFAYFEFDHPQGAQIIRHKFKVKIWELDWNLIPDKVHSVKDWPGSFAPFLKPQAIRREKEFATILRSIVPEPTNPARDMYSVIDWVQKNLKYSHDAASLKADANFAFETRGGHCSDYHGLCATMGRSLGYPMRVTYGWMLYPKNSPSHCRFEAYLPPYGWVPFDVSETQLLIQKIQADLKLGDSEKAALTKAAHDRLFRGFRETSWLLLTKGSHYQLAPKAVAPVSVVRTAYVEADGEILPDPDPANATQKQFAWMTVHQYASDRPFALPFKDYSTLKPY